MKQPVPLPEHQKLLSPDGGSDHASPPVSPTTSKLTKTTSLAQGLSEASSSPLASSVPFWPIAIAVTVIFLIHGWLAEYVVLKVVQESLTLGWFFALVTVIGQWVPAVMKRGWEKGNGLVIEHVIVGVAHCVALGLSNTGGFLVEYNTYALFKSSKVVFVMFVSGIFFQHEISFGELAAGLGLVGGLLVLSGADKEYAEESNRVTSPVMGAAMLFLGVSLSALVSVGQQAALQRRAFGPLPGTWWRWVWGPPNSKQGEALASKEDEREALLFWSNLVSGVLLGLVCAWNGELQGGLSFFAYLAGAMTWGIQIVALGLVAIGQRLVLTLNGAHGATASAAVLTFRKVASFITSVLVYPKPFHWIHAIGLTIVVVSAVMIQRAETQAGIKRASKESPRRDAKERDSIA